MADHNCKTCAFREKYDKNPKSLLGRIWRWHISWWPGWKSYMASLPENRRKRLARKYDLIKYHLKGFRMTVGNAVVANADLPLQYFPRDGRRVTYRSLCVSMALGATGGLKL